MIDWGQSSYSVQTESESSVDIEPVDLWEHLKVVSSSSVERSQVVLFAEHDSVWVDSEHHLD